MLKKLLYALVAFLHIPAEAVKMFGLANEISGVNKKTLPTELLPLNTIQLSRGLLNYTVLQSRLNWVFPYWAEKQYNPQSSSFIPRSHLGLSMNITERNWTAVGNPDCINEPIVDPRGLVTPFKDGWSVDVWMKAGDEMILPSKNDNAVQELVNGLPVVETKINSGGNTLTSTAYTYKSDLFIKATADSAGSGDAALIFSIRPFNPEGISIISSIKYEASSNSFLVNNKDRIYFNKKPISIYCSNFEGSDVLHSLFKKEQKYESACEYGMCTAAALFDCSLEENTVTCTYSITNKAIVKPAFYSTAETEKYWNELFKQGAEIDTPDRKINSIFNFSIATLLMLIDNDSITPGPFTYHQFWIRDAAFMLYALDKTGYSGYTLPVIKSYKNYLDKNGYFRSQQGEWDSNGQILWSVYQHCMLSNNNDLSELYFENLLQGVKWIYESRITDSKSRDKSYYGLLPAGMSAEHLGLVDHYYWDNFWSLAGLKSFEAICKKLNRHKELDYVRKLILVYDKDVDDSIKRVCAENDISAIPASCTRGNDCGMIGSICGLYPLQLFGTEDKRMAATLDTIYDNYFFKGMFFQSFIHSGMNAYLTLHVAHSYLYSGNRERYWEILNSVLSFSTPTLTYPEAIHPFTGGGSMGDGHHGWAAAEIVSIIRDAFVYEKYNDAAEFTGVVLLAGIPDEWFNNHKPFGIKNVPVPGGIVALKVIPYENVIVIKIDYLNQDSRKNIKARIMLPFEAEKVTSDNIEIKDVNERISAFNVNLPVKEIIISRKRSNNQAVSSRSDSSEIISL